MCFLSDTFFEKEMAYTVYTYGMRVVPKKSDVDISPFPEGNIMGETRNVASTHTSTRSGVMRVIGMGVAVLGICGLVIGAYTVGKYGFSFPQLSFLQPNSVQPTVTGTIPMVAARPLFSGKLTRLNQNLAIFRELEDDALNGVSNDFVYYSAGEFLDGELAGYTRIIAIRPSIGPGGPLSYVLATKDYQSYILDDPDRHTALPEEDWANPYTFLDRNKVTAVTAFISEQPAILGLDTSFSLFRVSLPVMSVETAKKDKNGNVVYDTPLVTDFGSYTSVSSPIANLSLLYKPYTSYRNMDELDADEKQKERLRQTYVLGDTEVVAVDSTGLPVTYALTTPESAQQYATKKKKYDQDVASYHEAVKKLQGSADGSDYPPFPDYVYLPHLGFTRSDIKAPRVGSLFDTYDQAIPGACASSLNTRIMNVSKEDLEQIGTVQYSPVYRLKDSNHPLYTLAYKNKLDYYDVDTTAWEQLHKGLEKPTLSSYVKKNPLLFIEDYWHRWVALGEYDIQLPGGCGKPVVYLYPPEPTDISVTFDAPVHLTTEIPTYAGSWMVRAQPNGSLTNLKPEFTRCDFLPIHAGTSYARQACETNTYPYLYWAGTIRSDMYPAATDGWVVAREDLEDFLSDTLYSMGFTARESDDFLTYWLPEMHRQQMPYYHIRFLQTQEVNRLFPMSVSPNPDTIFRIFMDYMPLSTKPPVAPREQTLGKLVRHGFTLVEWGGVRRP